MGGQRVSLSKTIKSSVKQAVSFIQNFEESAVNYALDEECSTVICGHIHQQADKWIEEEGKSIHYLNSGDWVENLTALEYSNRQWSLYHYSESGVEAQLAEEFEEADLLQLLKEFNLA